jgi:hypothetical protein
MKSSNSRQRPSKDLPVDKAATFVLDESRMILPGIQALFGFQLMVVFNDAFTEKLTVFEQRLHLVAITLLLITTITIMTQAVFHRQTGVKDVDNRFIHIATRLLLFSMMPLATSVCMEFYLISRLIINNIALSLVFTLVLFGLFLMFWFALPRMEALQRLFAGSQQE